MLRKAARFTVNIHQKLKVQISFWIFRIIHSRIKIYLLLARKWVFLSVSVQCNKMITSKSHHCEHDVCYNLLFFIYCHNRSTFPRQFFYNIIIAFYSIITLSQFSKSSSNQFSLNVLKYLQFHMQRFSFFLAYQRQFLELYIYIYKYILKYIMI